MTTSEAAPFASGISFTSVCINVSLYLPWLASQCLHHGLTLRRADLRHISEAGDAHPSGQPADVIVNCTGLSSLRLGGVADARMHPIRGQIALVRNEADVMAGTSGTDDGADELCYIMQRAGGGGTVLGGCYQKGSWDARVDEDLAGRIMRRAVELCPALVGERSMPTGAGGGITEGRPPSGVRGLSVVRHCVGLRPGSGWRGRWCRAWMGPGRAWCIITDTVGSGIRAATGARPRLFGSSGRRWWRRRRRKRRLGAGERAM